MRRRPQKLPPNQVVGGDSFFKPRVQTKLSMGTPGDKYEVEADRMADQVVNKTSGDGAVQKMEGEEEVQQKPLADAITSIQRMELAEEEPVQAMEEEEPVQAMEEEEPVQAMEEEEPVQAMEEEEPVQAKCAECDEGVQKMEEEEEAVQSKSNTPHASSPSMESKLSRGTGGSKMDNQTRLEMEMGFGADFSNVNIHTDENAVQLSQELEAQAFTHGNDVYFNKGKYNPDSNQGKHLLAHELTHTIQQNGNSGKQPNVQKLSNPDCSTTGGLPISGSCRSGYRNTCYSETFIPSSGAALHGEVSVDYNTTPGPWLGPEDFSVQVYKCGFLDDTRIGSKRLGPNIPGTLNFTIASVTSGDKYYIKIYSRSNLPLDASYRVWQ